MSEFVARLEEINSLAERSDGFIWRLKDEGGNATAICFDQDNRIIVNMSVWSSVTSLQNFVYKSGHREVLMKRKEWFENLSEIAVGMWFIPLHSFPSIDDARFRLGFLRMHGPTPFCFSFGKSFQPEEYVNFLNLYKSIDKYPLS